MDYTFDIALKTRILFSKILETLTCKSYNYKLLSIILTKCYFKF